jgi:uncharacterized membrane protein YozB (DUF420 family)
LSRSLLLSRFTSFGCCKGIHLFFCFSGHHRAMYLYLLLTHVCMSIALCVLCDMHTQNC